ncbi:MAG: AAA family ATPase, partial [Phycisphaerae bacterium]|nr:AAA family ATPase [Phycisphaerae bacterium]
MRRLLLQCALLCTLAQLAAGADSIEHSLRIADIHVDVLEDRRIGDVLHVDLARRAYNVVLEPGSGATARQLAAANRGMKELDDAVTGASGAMESIFPPLRILWQQERLLVQGNAETAAMKAAVTSLLSSRAGAILASTNDQFIVVGLAESGSASVERALRAKLRQATDHIVLDDRDLYGCLDDGEVDLLRYGGMPPVVLARLTTAYSSGTSKPIGIAIVIANEAIADGPLHAARASMHLWVPSSTTEGAGNTSAFWSWTGLAMEMPGGSWWPIVIGLGAAWPIAMLASWVCRKLDRTLEEDQPSPWWIPFGVAAAAMIIASVGNMGLHSMEADLSVPLLSARGVTLLGITLASFAVLPFALSYLSIATLKSVKARLGNPDFIAVILAAAVVAAGGMVGRAIWQSEGPAAGIISMVALIAVTAIGSIAAARLLGRSADRRGPVTYARSGIVFAAWAAFMIVFLTGRPDPAIGVAASVIVIFLIDLLAVPRLLQLKSRRDVEDHNSPTGTATKEAVSAMLTNPQFITTPELEAEIEASAQHLVGPESRIPRIEIVLIEAPRGAGKTRIARAIAAQCGEVIADQEPDAQLEVLFGDCDDPAGGAASVPCEPFAQALAQYVDAAKFQDPLSFAQALKKGVATVSTTVTPGAGGAIGALLAAGGDEAADQQFSDLAVAELVGKKLRQIAARGKRVVFILDDMQWADATGVMGVLPQVVSTIASDADEHGANDVCFIFTARTSPSTPGMATFKEWLQLLEADGTVQVHRVPMQRLMSENQNHFRDTLLTGSQWLNLLPTDAKVIRSTLAARELTAPLDVLALLKTALAKDLLRPGGKRVRLVDDADLSMLSVESDYDTLVKAELETLDPKLLDLLQCCALVGRRFKPSVIAGVFRMDLIELLQHLRDAESRQLIRDDRPMDDHYEFTEKRYVRVLRSMCSDDLHEQTHASEIARAYHKRLVDNIKSQYGITDDIPDNVPEQDLIAIADHSWAVHDATSTDAFQFAALVGARLTQRCAFRPALRILGRAAQYAQSHADSVAPVDAAVLGLDYIRVLQATGTDSAALTATADWVRLLVRQYSDDARIQSIGVDIDLIEVERLARSPDPEQRTEAQDRIELLQLRNDLAAWQRARAMFYA